MGATGTVSIDFGAFPGKSDVSYDVTGQTAIAADSKVGAWIRAAATADHSADEHWLEAIEVFAGNVVAGTGFTIYARNASQLNEPVASHTRDNRGGKGTLIYGAFTVTWAWH